MSTIYLIKKIYLIVPDQLFDPLELFNEGEIDFSNKTLIEWEDIDKVKDTDQIFGPITLEK